MIFDVALRPEAGASLSWCRSINGASLPSASLQRNHNPRMSPNGKLKKSSNCILNILIAVTAVEVQKCHVIYAVCQVIKYLTPFKMKDTFHSL